MNSFIRNFSRVFTGLVFIFSGFVKGVDPMGTAYKFDDYFIALNIPWMSGMSVALAIIMIAAEFILGWFLLFNFRTKLSAWFVLGFMLFFTPLTLWLAISDKVHDCGCFGDFLVMTNTQTFIKNLVLLVFVIILFTTRKAFRNAMAGWKQIAVALLGVVIIFYLMHSGYNHEPKLDFRPFKVGANLSENMLPIPEISEVNLIYQHTETGEELSYTTKTLPFNDSILFPKLKFLRQEKKIIQEFQPAAASFEMFGTDGHDYSSEIIGFKDFILVLFIQDIEKANKNAFVKIAAIQEEAAKRKIRMVAVSGSAYDTVEKFLQEAGTPMEHYSADVIKIKTVVRANPGLLLLKNGHVLGKWHYHDFPELKTLNVCGSVDAFAPVTAP